MPSSEAEHGGYMRQVSARRRVEAEAAADSCATAAAGMHHALVLRPIPTAPDNGFYLRVGKRLIDVVLSALGLVLAAPIIALASLAVRLESGSPTLYRSERVGRGGRRFVFYKLRSMHTDAEETLGELQHLNEVSGPVFKMASDPRITRVGRFLRTTSLDELPQLWNVLRGDMSLVGPRPPIPEEVAKYQDWQLGRLAVTPGLTCFWQVRGRVLIGFDDWVRMDLDYVACRGLRTDLHILLATLPAVISRRGAF
jgi:lipopolysaccharide/colanic/teichoic acid biosynthesis glycosyltransferase